MENSFKRFLSLALAILMVFSNIPTAAFASEVVDECLHNSFEINSTATCTEAGETITTCLLCGETLSTAEADATGHNYVDGVCKDCGEADPNYVAPMNLEPSVEPSEDPSEACEHNYVDVVTDPTCTEAGFTTHTCDKCNDSYTDSTVDATGHTYESVVTDPTCTAAGFTTKTCAACGDVQTTDEVAALGHTAGEEGKCSVCGEAMAAPVVDDPVAKVGNVEYATIDEAIANWADGTTLTLISDVTLSDVIKLKSTEHHTLDLGTFTMTAASGKHAIEITCEGRSSASYALTVNADASNPGGINAPGKACIYYKKSGSTKDRPIIRIYNGVFNGSYSINSTSNGNTNCPQIWIYGGTFNSYMSLTKNMLRVFGGTFHASINCTGDTSAYREISGGRFKSWQFMTADAASKFWVGTSQATYDVGLYVDEEGYLVVGGPVITELSSEYPAVADNCTKWSSYLKYSSAATYGLFYKNADMAIAKHGEDHVKVYVEPAVVVDKAKIDEIISSNPDAATTVNKAVEQIKNNEEVESFVPTVPEGAKLVIKLADMPVEGNAPAKVIFDVAPMKGDTKVQPEDKITFRLPVPSIFAGNEYVNVSHKADGQDNFDLLGLYEIKGEDDNARYVEIDSADFSEFAVEPTNEEPVAQIDKAGYATLQAAVNAVKNGETITLMADIAENVTIEQKADVKFTIKGEGKKMTGMITVDGKSEAYATAGVTIQNVNFDATNITSDASINLSDGTTATRYTSNVTVENCSFITDGSKEKAAIKSYQGGDKNLTVTGCTVDSTMHSLLQAANIAGVVIDGCTVNSKNGINLNSSSNVEIKNSTIDVSGYAVRAGVSGGSSGKITLTNNTLKNTSTEDAVIVIRGTASEQIDLTMTQNMVSGATHISGTTAATKVSVDANYWDGKEAPVVNGTAVEVKSYYADKALATLKKNVLDGDGSEENPYLINNVDDLLLFQKKVDEQAQDGSSQFAGKYFKMTNDIDLADINWNPIGSMSGDHGSFKGIFDGGNHTISNLKVEQAGNGLGLFAYTSGNAEIKNLKLENVTVKSTNNSSYVGGLVGNAYASTKITNVHVTGNIVISGCGYIGGIAGHGYVVMDNVSVVGTGTIYSTFWCAGGILGYAGEGSTNIMNARVEGITITSAAGGLGAIVGMAEDNNGTQPISGSNLSAKNVEITTYTGAYGNSYADYALGYLYGGNETSILTGNLSVENVKVETSTGAAPTIVDAVASIGDNVYFSLQDAVNAGGVVKLNKDVTLTETLTIPAGKTITLDLNGKTISQSKACTASYEMINNKGTLTITGNGKISFKDTSAGDPTFGWGSYTIRNEGTLVVENGTIEHKGAQAFATHMICAIFQYSGSTTINGGTISTPNYRSVRLWKGDMTINGGTFDGQVWVQCVDDSAKLAIAGGKFSPNGGDASSVFISNADKKAELSVTGGTFNGKIGTANAEALAGAITGGSFTETAKNGTNAALLHKDAKFPAEANAEGYYTIVAKVYVAKIGNNYYESLAEAVKAIATDGSDTTIKLLTDIELEENVVFDYGTGKIIFTADKPVIVKQTKELDLNFTKAVAANIVVEENVTFQIYSNNSGMYLYYGPSLTVNGAITGGSNWGCLYLFNGNHLIGETGKVAVGRIQTAYDELTVNGEIDTNYLLVERATFTADGAIVDANVIFDNNNSVDRWGASQFVIKNSSTVKTSKLTLSYPESTLTIDLSSTLEATAIAGNGKIIIDGAAFAGDEWLIKGDASKFEGTIEIINNPDLKYEITDEGIVVKAKVYVAQIGNAKFESLEEAFAAAQSGETITLLADATLTAHYDTGLPTAASVIDLGGKTLTLTKTDIRFGTTTFKNGAIDFAEGLKASTGIFYMFGDHTLTFDNVTVDATGVIGNYLISVNDTADVVLTNGAKIVADNETAVALTAIISCNGSENFVTIDNASVEVKNITGRAFLGGNYTVKGGSVIKADAVKEGFFIRAGQKLSIEDTSSVTITLNPDSSPRYGINLNDPTAIYTKAETATVTATVVKAPYKVATKDELNAALSAAKEGDTILLTADIDYGTDQLAITKAITLDLGGKTLTTRNAWGGMSIKGNPTVKNGTIVHASNTAAIKVWNATAFEDLVIDVQGKGDANKVIGGIVLQEGSTTRVGSIKNVTIKGAALTNGIETYNCGDATENVIGAMENVNIDAKGTGLLISAPCGTATNCSVKGGVNGIEIWIKGNYSASLELVDSDVKGGVYAHDEFTSNPEAVNNGTLSLTVDEATTGVSAETITLKVARAQETVEGILEELIKNASAKINNIYYASLTAAVAAVQNGETITLLKDIKENVTLTEKTGLYYTIDGNDKTMNGSFTINSLSDTEDNRRITVKNIKFVDNTDAEVSFINSVNKNHYPRITVEGCTFTGSGNDGDVAVRLKSSHSVVIKDCTGSGLHSFLQNTSGWNLTIENVTVTESKSGLALGTVQGVTVKGCNIDVAGYGIRMDAQYNNNAVIESNTVEAFIPVVVRKATVDSSVTFNGTNTMTATNEDEIWCAIGTSEYETNGTMPTAPTSKVKVTLNDTGLNSDGIYGNYYVASIDGALYQDLAEAFAEAKDGDEVKIHQPGNYKVPSGKNITVTSVVKPEDGNVVFDNIGAHNMGGASMTFNNVTFNYGNEDYKGLQHSGNLVYNNCTINGQVFLYGQSETFVGCTFNQTSSDAYNVWTYGAKKVLFNECTFNSAGKSVLVYAESASISNEITVTNTKFNASAAVDGKAAIEIDTSLTAGATITIDAATKADGFANGSVSGNSLWNNKKGSNTDANNDITVTVAGVEVLKPVTFVAKIGDIGYATLDAAIKAAKAGETVKVFAGTYKVPAMKAGITIEGEVDENGETKVLLEGTLSGTLDNLTLKNLHIKGGNAQRWAYAKGDLVFENVTFEATSVYALHFDGIAAGTNLTYKNCTIIGWAAMGGSPASCVFDGCTIKGNGTYGVIRTYFDATIKDCTFDVANVNPNDAYQDGIHAVDGAKVTVTGCTNANGNMTDLVNVSGASVVTVDGDEIKNLAKIGEKYYANFEAAYAAAQADDEITLLAPVVVAAGETLTLDKDVTVTYTSSVPGEDMFTVKGDLVVNGATLVYSNSDTTASNVTVSTISAEPGSTVTVKSGTVKNDSANNATKGIYAYAIDLLTNGNLGDVTATISGGEVISTNYMAIRQFNNGTACKNTLTVTGGKIYGAKRAIQVHMDNNAAYTTISGGTIEGGDYSLCLLTSSGNISVTGGTFLGGVYSGTNGIITGGFFKDFNVEYYLADGYRVVYKGGMLGVEANPVANVEGVNYTTLQAAIDAAANGETVHLMQNIALNDSVTVKGNVTLNLKNFNITGTDNVTKNFGLINIDPGAELTINGNGKITLTATNNRGWGAYSSVISNQRGKLTVNGGTIEHLGGTDMAYAIDVLTNTGAGDAETVINGGNVKSTYRAIRLFANSTKATTILTVNGGTIEGANKAVWVQGANASNNPAKLTVGKDATLNGDVYLTASKGIKEWTTEISVASAALAEGKQVLTSNIPEKLVLAEVDGVYNLVASVASVDGIGYATIQKAIAAAEAAEEVKTVKLQSDIELAESIKTTKNLIIDLNGKTITGKDIGTASFGLIYNTGALIIDDTVGGGKITLEATNNRGWNAYSSVISNNPGGKLTVKAGTIEHLGGTDMAYGIDNLTNGKGTYAETVITGGTVKSTYRAIRQFLNGTEAQNILTVNGGTIEGANKSIWMQDPSKNANTGSLTVGEDAALKGDVYLSVTEGSTSWPVTVSVAAAALEGNSTVMANDHVPSGYEVKNINGTWGVKGGAAKIGETYYATLADAIAAAQAGDTITLIADVNENVTIKKNVTIDGANFKYTGTMTANAGLTVTVQNVNFVNGGIAKSAKNATGNYTIKNCTFDGEGVYDYPCLFKGANSIAIENCTVKDYKYSFLYVTSSANNVSVKDVTVENCPNYAVYFASGVTTAVFENLTVKNSNNGFVINNTANRAFTIKNCKMENVGTAINHASGTNAITCTVLGNQNDFGTAANSQYAKYVLADADATLTAGAGLNVTTSVEGYEVEYQTDKYVAVPIVRVAKIGDVEYKTLAKAIEAAKAGATITFLEDITENVTVNKSVTIDGAEKNYTGTMTLNNVNVTIENVNFVNGQVYKNKKTGANANITIKNSTFDGEGLNGYAVNLGGTNAIVIENVTASDYGYGFLQVPSSNVSLSVTNVTISDVNYGLKIDYSNGVALENVTVAGANYGLYDSNFGKKTYTINGCDLSNIKIWERSAAQTTTFKFVGENAVDELYTGEYAKYVLADANATLTAPEAAPVASGVENMVVYYADGAHKLGTPVAAIGETGYVSIQAAVDAANDGDVITVTAAHELTWDGKTVIDGSMASMVVVAGKTVTIDLNGQKLTVDGSKMNGTDLYAVFAADDKGHLTLKDSVGTGSVEAKGIGFKATVTAYCLMMAYEPETSLTVNGGTYYMEAAHDSLIYTGGDECVTINGGNFTLGNVGTGENGKPWIFNGYGKNANAVIVNGGTFNAEINHQFWANEVYMPETKALLNNGDGTWTVENAVAYAEEIGTSTDSSIRKVGYNNLADAIANVMANGTVTLLANAALTETIELTKSITVDAGEFTMTGSFKLMDKAITLTAPAGLTVTTDIADHKVVYASGVYSVDAKNYTVQIKDGEKFETLAEAIAAAKSGDTITFLADITEDVTISKDLIIDGVKGENGKFKYTGNISVKGSSVDVTVKNVDFVNGTGYAITTNTIKSITVENCKVSHYGYGFLYANKSTPTITVKNVNVDGGNYGIHWVYGTSANLENVTMNNVAYGLYIQNYAAKTITLKNCDIDNTNIWERDGYSAEQTFKFVGKNTVGTLSTSQYAKYVLASKDAFLITDEVTDKVLDISSDFADYKVAYDSIAYKLVAKEYVAQIGEGENAQKFESLAEAFKEAQNGDIITMIADHVMDGSKAEKDSEFGYDNLIVNGKSITLDFAGHTVEVTPNFAAKDDGGFVGTLEAIIFLENNATLTMQDETGKGGFNVKEGTDLYSLIYNRGSTLNILSGNYYVEKLVASGSLIYADGNQKTTVAGGVFTLGNAGADAASTKPWLFNTHGKNERFVQITGGYFNDNPYKNYGTGKDCEVDIAEGAFFQQIKSGEYAGYWTLANAVAQYDKTGAYFATVEDALKAAKAEGGKVTVLRDVTAEDSVVMVPAGVTLDLNGKYLTAENLIAFGSVIDDGAESGGLKISNKTSEAMVSLQPKNAYNDIEYLPIYDTTTASYKFFAYSVENLGAKEAVAGVVDTSKKKLGVRINFSNREAYNVLINSTDYGFELIYDINWNATALNPTPIRYTFKHDTIVNFAKTAYNQMGSGNVKAGISVTLTGLDTLSERKITFIPKVVSKTYVSQIGGEDYIDIPG